MAAPAAACQSRLAICPIALSAGAMRSNAPTPHPAAVAKLAIVDVAVATVGQNGSPFAVTLQPGYTHTEVGQPGGAAPRFGPNNNITVQATSLYTGGRITDNLGAFIQGTYDNVSRRFGWDQADIRFADTVNVADTICCGA